MPNNAPNSTDSFPPELEMALVSLEKGRQDLKAVDKWQADKDVSVEIIGFHIQQAIEKSLKAVLLSRRIDFPRTHNLGLIIGLCQSNGISDQTNNHPYLIADRIQTNRTETYHICNKETIRHSHNYCP